MKYKNLLLFPALFLLLPLNTQAYFEDVYLDHPFYDVITYYEGLGLIDGYDTGEFLSEEKINRVEVLKMLLKIKGVDLSEAAETQPNFTDISLNQWYGDYLKYAYQKGYVKGYPDKTFRPGKGVTLAETLSMLYQVYQQPVDKTSPEEWYKPYLQEATEAGLLKRLSTDEPHENLTRGEVLSLIYTLDTGNEKQNFVNLEKPYTVDTLDEIVKQMGYADPNLSSEFSRLKEVVEEGLYNDYLLPVQTHIQERALSCEIASLKTVLDYHQQGDLEATLFEKLAKAEPYFYNSESNVWGDPNEGFVGNVDGSQFGHSGYGVYWEPIAELGKQYMPDTYAFRGWNLEQLLQKVIEGKPVIIWGYTYANGGLVDLTWETPEGKTIYALNGEHTFTVIGFKGNIENPSDIILIDPLVGKVSKPTESFLKNWNTFGNSGVVVERVEENVSL